jgi:RHS repeat-associated protein
VRGLAALGLGVLLGLAPPLRAQTPEYIYDTRNKFVEVRRGESLLVRFQWDAEGRLLRKIGQLGIRDYVYDGRRLLAEYTESGDQVAKYNWAGDRVVSVERTGEGIRYFHYDGLGSVVTLTDDSGNVVARYLWDAWGNLRNEDALNASQNRIGYTGHRFDEETGLHHAQTRHLDPTIGRFTTQDAYLGEPDDPASQNRFTYAQGNPAKYVDPTGEFVFLVPILIGVIAAELDVIHQEVTQGKDLFTLDPSKGVDAARAAKTGAIAAAATATGQLLAGGALAGTGALGIGGTAIGATGTSTGSGLIAGTVGGTGAAWTGGTLGALGEGKSLDTAVDQGSIAALPGAIGGATGVLAGSATQALASSAGATQATAQGMSAFTAGFAADQAAQQTLVATGLQERSNLAQSFASGAIAYVVTEGTDSTPKLEPAIRQPPSRRAVPSGPRAFSAIHPGPLPPNVAETFAGGRYGERVLQDETVFYKVHGGRSGPIGRGGGTFVSPNPQVGGTQSQIDLALRPEWGNTATKVTRIRVPAGTVVYEGLVSSQGGPWVGGRSQVYIPKVDPNWIVK